MMEQLQELYMTERIKALKERTLAAPRYLSLEQARIITRVYRECSDLPVGLKRARALACALEEMPIAIDPAELIVGNRTPDGRAGVVFPEAGISWLEEEIETLPTRPQDTFEVREQDIHDFRTAILPYGKGKSLEDDIYAQYGAEIKAIEKVVKINQKNHARWAKHTQFEQSMRSPLMARFPGRQKIVGETRALAESVDIYPTLCDFAGLKTPGFVEGESFMPVIEGKANGKQAAFSQIQPVGKPESRMMAYSVRTKDFRYVEWRDWENNKEVVHTELYDHRHDPEETVSVADNPEFAGVIKAHAKLVRENYGSLKK